MPFKFPARRHFEFYDVSDGCRYCLEAEDLLCETIGQPLHVIRDFKIHYGEALLRLP